MQHTLSLVFALVALNLTWHPFDPAAPARTLSVRSAVLFTVGDRRVLAWTDYSISPAHSVANGENNAIYSAYLGDLGERVQTQLAKRTSPACNCTLSEVRLGPELRDGSVLLEVTGSSGAVGQLALVYRLSAAGNSPVNVERLLETRGRALRWHFTAADRNPQAIIVDDWYGSTPSRYRVFRYDGREFRLLRASTQWPPPTH
jgi:hypothetical protein